PHRGDIRRGTDHCDHLTVQTGLRDGPTEMGKCVELAGDVVHESGVVVLPSHLVLLGSSVVVHGEHLDAGSTGSSTQENRGFAAVGADLDDRTDLCVGQSCFEQDGALVRGHEAFGCFSSNQEVRGDCRRHTRIFPWCRRRLCSRHAPESLWKKGAHHEVDPHQPGFHMFTNPHKRKEEKAHKAPPPLPFKKTVAATYSPTPPQGSTISVRRLHDRVRKETGYNPSTKTTTEKNREQRARTPSYLQRTSPRPISTGQLHPLQGFHARPINPIIHREP